MDKIYASNLLRITLEASGPEIEAAYLKRREEVGKRLEAARDRNTRIRLEREYIALEEARKLLVPEPVDVVIVPPTEPEALPVEPEAAMPERQASPAELKDPPLGPEPMLVAREVPEGVEALTIERVPLLMNSVSPVIDRVSTPIDDASSPIDDVSLPIDHVSGSIANVSLPNEPVSPSKEPERPLDKTVSTQAQACTPQQRQLAIRGVVLVLASVSAMVFFWIHAANKPKFGKFVLNTVPHGADVWLDGNPRGRTPLVLENVDPGDRELKIELAGYKPERLIVAVKTGDEGYTRIIQLVPDEKSPANPTIRQDPKNPVEATGALPTSSANVLPSASPSEYPGEVYPQTRQMPLTEADVADLGSGEIQYAINEMLARHGYSFKNHEDKRKPYDNFDWYKPVDGTEDEIQAKFFSDVEKSNYHLLARLRDERRAKKK
jgi:hypothetical protein